MKHFDWMTWTTDELRLHQLIYLAGIGRISYSRWLQKFTQIIQPDKWSYSRNYIYGRKMESLRNNLGTFDYNKNSIVPVLIIHTGTYISELWTLRSSVPTAKLPVKQGIEASWLPRGDPLMLSDLPVTAYDLHIKDFLSATWYIISVQPPTQFIDLHTLIKLKIHLSCVSFMNIRWDWKDSTCKLLLSYTCWSNGRWLRASCSLN